MLIKTCAVAAARSRPVPRIGLRELSPLVRPAARAGQRIDKHLRQEVRPRDPLVFAEAALVLASSAAIAAFIPARRAASIDPARALRSE